jgi:hypothetical protein
LEAYLHDGQAWLRYAETLERAGHRIVDGEQTGRDGWVISDWRTKQVIAGGVGGLDGYDAEAARLDPDSMWVHRSRLDDEVPLTDVETPGVPRSLGLAIEDWLGAGGTPDEEVAEFIGWPVDKVSQYRDQLS